MKLAKRALSNAIAALLFGPLTPLYDRWTWAISLGRWRTWQLAALPHVEGRDVLELGCGPGHLISAIAARGHAAYAVDVSPGMLGQVVTNAARRGVRVPACRAQAQRLPFASASFDTVVLCFSGLAWLPNVLAECRRVLKPAGLLLVVDEVRFPRRALRTRLTGGLLSLFDCEEDETPHDAPLREAGFDVDTVDEPVNGDLARLLLGRPA